MRTNSWTWASVALLAMALSPSIASAKKGIVLITTGETITPLGSANEQNLTLKVGYKYDYFGIFWLDFWTSGGTFCLHDGDRYAPITREQAEAILGSKASPPFLYHVPLGWLIVGPLVVLGVFLAIRNRRRNDISHIFKDERYLAAMRILNERYVASAPPPPAEGETPPPEDENRFKNAFEAGVDHLVASGLPRETAERNFAIMVNVILQAKSDEPETPKS